MSGTTPKPPPKQALSGKQQKKPPVILKPKTTVSSRRILGEDPIAFDIVVNEQVENDHHTRLLSVVFSQTIAVSVLTVLLIVLAPFTQPIYHYYARDPAGNFTSIDALLMPNMTNRAVLSWAVTSVTEIMTIGFGDLIPQLGAQKPRFTEDGWTSFVAAFKKQGINEAFKGHQLVLTTVPSDTAVILSQGQNKEGIYQWKLQVPVIMTYTTNNNVNQGHHSIVTLTIVRVRPEQNPSGIAIKNLLVSQ